MTRTLRALALAVTTIGLGVSQAGCTRGLPTCRPPVPTQYFRIDYRVRAEGGIVPPVVLREAAQFPALRTLWTDGKAAVRLPDKCLGDAGESTGVFKGEPTRDRAILSTKCGFLLAELERALSAAHYKVVSWNSLSQVEVTQKVPTYVAARSLGADFVFIVNSLEADYGRLGTAFTESLKFFDSDEGGARGAPRELDQEDRNVLKDFVRERTQTLRDKELLTRITAVLDVTAVDTKTGEAVWFFNKQEAKPLPLKHDARFLFAYYPERPGWWPVSPREEQAVHRAESKRSAVDEQSSEEGPVPESAYEAEKNELSRHIVEQFMKAFRGEGG